MGLHVEKKLGIGIEIKEFEEEPQNLDFTIRDDKKHLILMAEPGETVDISVDGRFLLSAISSKKGEICIDKKSNVGRELLLAMGQHRKITLQR